MRYYIAYKDKDYLDFHGDPWIVPSESGFPDLESAVLKVLFLNKEGHKDVTLFEAEEVPEVITWEFVEQHKLKEQ
jgi:hypothetical protein